MSRVFYIFLLGFSLLLSGCGFSPLYGKNSVRANIQPEFDSIFIANIPDHEGQFLRNALMDRLYQNGRPYSPKYTLSFSPIKEAKADLDVTKNSDTTRVQLRLSTHMKLSDNQSGNILLERDLISIASYNILQSQFTTRVSEENTRQNVLNILAEQAETQLALYFNRSAP